MKLFENASNDCNSTRHESIFKKTMIHGFLQHSIKHKSVTLPAHVSEI